jgi:hypothetical protein
MRLAPDAVYTILHPEKLAAMAASKEPIDLRETKRWVTAEKLFEDASRQGHGMIVVYADAANDSSRLICWGLLTGLKVDATGTSYTVTNVTPLRKHRTQELVLRSTGKTIADGYLRPYAVVRTPAFIVQTASGALRAGRQSAPRTKGDTTTLFSFGYWGSGSATRALVDAVNEAEALRGFEAPLWVDIRISRSVRAAGFRDGAFEKLLGGQYLHMRGLGNSALGTGGLTIKEPAAAEELLDHALANPARRVIFFCSCELPGGCHRHAVSRLLIKAARRRGLAVTVIEWPGGEPIALRFEVPTAVLRGISRESQKTLALPHGMSVGAAASLPWASTATLFAGDESVSVLLGPAQFTARGAHLKVMAVAPRANDGVVVRNKNGYAAMTSSR